MFDGAHVGGPGSGKDAELFQPDGPGPRPAMVILSGCDGVGPHYRVWGRRLVGWGYAALVVDSFNTRGVRSVCAQGDRVPPAERAQDALRAADWLRTQPGIRGDRIGVIGFSHGGWTVTRLVQMPQSASLAAAIAYYPGCPPPRAPLRTDVLILIGDADDWTPADRCREWAGQVKPAGHDVQLRVYPGARHGFDTNAAMHVSFGHVVAGDASSARLAEQETRTFLDARLK